MATALFHVGLKNPSTRACRSSTMRRCSCSVAKLEEMNAVAIVVTILKALMAMVIQIIAGHVTRHVPVTTVTLTRQIIMMVRMVELMLAASRGKITTHCFRRRALDRTTRWKTKLKISACSMIESMEVEWAHLACPLSILQRTSTRMVDAVVDLSIAPRQSISVRKEFSGIASRPEN